MWALSAVMASFSNRKAAMLAGSSCFFCVARPRAENYVPAHILQNKCAYWDANTFSHAIELIIIN
jgi:hypothetical protein